MNGSGIEIEEADSSQRLPALSLGRLIPFFGGADAPYASADAFRQLYERTHLSIYRFVYSLHGGPAEDVEDLAAETFERAWRARRRFRGDEDAAMGWLITIARNRVIDAQRRRKRRPAPAPLDTLSLATPAAAVERQVVHREAEAALLAALQTLSLEAREMVILRYVLGWQVKRIAAHYDLRENTASVRLRRSLERLRQQWPFGPEEHP